MAYSKIRLISVVSYLAPARREPGANNAGNAKDVEVVRLARKADSPIRPFPLRILRKGNRCQAGLAGPGLFFLEKKFALDDWHQCRREAVGLSRGQVRPFRRLVAL